MPTCEPNGSCTSAYSIEIMSNPTLKRMPCPCRIASLCKLKGVPSKQGGKQLIGGLAKSEEFGLLLSLVQEKSYGMSPAVQRRLALLCVRQRMHVFN